MVVQPFGARGRLITFVGHELTMRDAPPSWWVRRCCFQCDEVDCIEALEVVRATLVEGKRMGVVDFFIGGDLNIELQLCLADDEHRGLDSIEWYGMYGPECEGSAEDIIAYEKKLRWFQLLKDFNCTATSTWTNDEDVTGMEITGS